MRVREGCVERPDDERLDALGVGGLNEAKGSGLHGSFGRLRGSHGGRHWTLVQRRVFVVSRPGIEPGTP